MEIANFGIRKRKPCFSLFADTKAKKLDDEAVWVSEFENRKWRKIKEKKNGGVGGEKEKRRKDYISLAKDKKDRKSVPKTERESRRIISFAGNNKFQVI